MTDDRLKEIEEYFFVLGLDGQIRTLDELIAEIKKLKELNNSQ